MRTLYIDCSMGAAGDMLGAALLELHPDREDFLRRLNGLGLPGVAVTAVPAVRGGIAGTHLSVRIRGEEEAPAPEEHGGHVHAHGHHHDHEHPHDHGHHDDHGHDYGHEHDRHEGHDHHPHEHHTVGDIYALLDTLPLEEPVREDARAVYRLLAEAEGAVHGREMDQIHFHEVGTLDAVADVVTVCMLLHELKVERVAASPVHVGYGQVRCAHGLLPVPAPATARLLTGIPVAAGAVEGELCTPTGAALLRRFVREWGPMPPMTVERWGFGMGTKEFPGAANCLRMALGESEAGAARETLWELRCEMDDMTGEDLAFAAEELLAAGALDVYTTAVGMKKGRAGQLLTCLCRREDRERMEALLLRHTTTLGVRSCPMERRILPRRTEVRQTALGPVSFKVSGEGELRREKAEYEELAALCRARGLSMAEARKLAEGPAGPAGAGEIEEK